MHGRLLRCRIYFPYASSNLFFASDERSGRAVHFGVRVRNRRSGRRRGCLTKREGPAEPVDPCGEGPCDEERTCAVGRALA